MKTGDKIKYFRELRGLNKKELGIKLGYSPSTATVRISQYEYNKKKPKLETLSKIAEVLNIDISALVDINISTNIEFMRALFKMEEKYNLKTEKDGADFILRFSNLVEKNKQLQNYFVAWLDKQEQLDLGACSKKEYELWCAKFPDVAEVKKAQLAEKEKELEIQIEKIQEELERQTALLKAVKNKYSEV